MSTKLSTGDHGSGSLDRVRGIESAAALAIGQRIAEARARAGASRLDLAYHARVDPTNLGRYETGKALPNLATLVRLADTLGLDPGSLIEGLSFGDFPQDRDAPQRLPERARRTASTG